MPLLRSKRSYRDACENFKFYELQFCVEIMIHLIFIVVCALWGTSFILMKKAVLVFGPLSVGGIRVVGGAIALCLILILARYSWKNARHNLIFIIPVALLGSVYPYSIQPHLISRYDSSFIAIMVSMVPLMTILASIPLLKVWPRKIQFFGVLLGLFCIGVIFIDGLERSIKLIDLLITMTIPMSYAISNTLIKQKFYKSNPIILTFLILSFSSLFLLLPGLALEEVKFNDGFAHAFLAAVTLGVFCTGVPMVLFYKLIRDRGPLYAGMVTYVIPIVAIIWGWADGESITFVQLLALGGILISVFFVQAQSIKIRIPALLKRKKT